MKRFARIFKIVDDYFITALIIVNVAGVVLESYQELSDTYHEEFHLLELISVVVFSIEYLLRIIFSATIYGRKKGISSSLKYIFSLEGIIDFLAIIPFYLPMFITLDARTLRILRLFRLFRIFKLNYYHEALLTLNNVIKSKARILSMTIFTVLIFLVLTSAMMFELENDVQPDKFPNIVQTVWWAIATLTTVGYGDVYPVTNAGKILASITALLGIGLVAIPTGIISAGFVEELQKKIEKE